MLASLAIDTASFSGTERLAEAVADQSRLGDAILLEGPLGAGKTVFARALLRRVANNPALEVPSPTFTLVQSYELPRMRAHHFDLWRLAGPQALIELGWEEFLRDLVIVEWPDRLGPQHPRDALTVTFTPLSDSGRRLVLQGWPGRLERLA